MRVECLAVDSQIHPDLCQFHLMGGNPGMQTVEQTMLDILLLHIYSLPMSHQSELDLHVYHTVKEDRHYLRCFFKEFQYAINTFFCQKGTWCQLFQLNCCKSRTTVLYRYLQPSQTFVHLNNNDLLTMLRIHDSHIQHKFAKCRRCQLIDGYISLHILALKLSGDRLDEV